MRIPSDTSSPASKSVAAVAAATKPAEAHAATKAAVASAPVTVNLSPRARALAEGASQGFDSVKVERLRLALQEAPLPMNVHAIAQKIVNGG